MKSIPNEQHADNIAVIDRLQTQAKPLLTERTFNNAAMHEIMLYGYGELLGVRVTFSVVRGNNDWAIYYSSFSRSADYVAEHGQKASIPQALKLIQAEGDLIELYRR